MARKFSRFLFICVGIAIASLLPKSFVSAFAVSPVMVDRTLDPGASTHGMVRIVNESSREQMYSASVQNFIPIGEEGQQRFLPPTDTSALASWLLVDRASFSLKPGEVREFPWTLTLPKNAEPGGHYAVLFFTTTPKEDEAGSVGLGARTGVLFLINVTGRIAQSANLESFRVLTYGTVDETETVFFDRLPIQFELRVRNNGSVHIRPMGTIHITNFFGRVVVSVPANPSDGRILPGSVRRIVSQWEGGNPSGSGRFFDQLRDEWRGFALGRYTATLDLHYGAGQSSLTAYTTFWVFPWRSSLVLLVGIILLIGLFTLYNRMIVRSVMKRMKTRGTR